MRRKVTFSRIAFLVFYTLSISCNGGHLKGATTKAPTQAPKQETPQFDSRDSMGQQPVAPILKTCSVSYTVPGTANPYLAGVQVGTDIRYAFSNSIFDDVAPAQSPVQIIDKQNCIQAGSVVSFQVTGAIANGQASSKSTADGDTANIVQHMNGASLGKSQLRAPINSLIGVFLGAGDPSQAVAPELLDFSRTESRNYSELYPKVGQVFFIGDGQTDYGQLQSIHVPDGATRLYLGAMDAYEWKNNQGALSCVLQGRLMDSPSQ